MMGVHNDSVTVSNTGPKIIPTRKCYSASNQRFFIFQFQRKNVRSTCFITITRQRTIFYYSNPRL